MSQFQKVFKVVLSSPNDVRKERDIVFQSVYEINLTLQKYYNALIELRKWETHSKPSLGKYAQEIITVDLGDDFDIYLGIMWTKFGTPTPKAGSGTEEEFKHAYELYKAGRDIDIMFYFSGRKQSPEKSLQMNKVLAFKDRIRELGVFTWDYISLPDFSFWIRLHLTHKIYDFLAKSSTNLLQNYQKAVEINERISFLTQELGKITEDLGKEIDKYRPIQEEFSNYMKSFQSEVTLTIHQGNRSLLTYKLNSFNSHVKKILDKAYNVLDNQTKIFIQWLSIYTDAIFLIPQCPAYIRLELVNTSFKAIDVLISGFTKTIDDLKPMEQQALTFVEQNPLPQINAAFYKLYNFISEYPRTFHFYHLLVKNVEIKLSEIKQTITIEE